MLGVQGDFLWQHDLNNPTQVKRSITKLNKV